ncbi:hypothetical protein ACFY4C_20420 [Actinomadura viridis]|uniref:hypothetical protein n=1 Tax=Actinomadura viridis TaxID=58110 RepID=UPI0036992082
MTPAEIQDLAAEVRRVFPRQATEDLQLERWPDVLQGVRYSEALIAVAMLRYFRRWVEPEHILDQVKLTRTKVADPWGQAWEDRTARHGGQQYRGGPVCWNPQERCEGICRDCPLEAAGEAS